MARVDERQLALARVYARALLALAEERGESETLLAELGELARHLDRDPEFAEFIASPLVDDERRRETLEQIFRGRASDLLVDALQVLNRKGRLGVLRTVAEAFRRELREARGLVDVRVRTAVPLPPPLRVRLVETVRRFSGGTPELAEVVDPKVLGGLVVELEGKKLDASLAARLRELGAALARRASEEILRRRAAPAAEAGT
ncbi:MAG: ATP synthase F1 subunit delta [Thermoanaerobaculia bacterium]